MMMIMMQQPVSSLGYSDRYRYTALWPCYRVGHKNCSRGWR